MGTFPLIRSGSFETLSAPLLIDPVDPVQMGFTRTGNAARFDATGTLRTVPSHVPALDFDPVTLERRGVRFEGQDTEYLPNNSMAGASVETNALPTSWTQLTTPAGLSRQIAGVGTVSGMPSIDIRWSGTVSSPGSMAGFFHTNNTISAAPGETFAAGARVALVGGDLTNVGALHLRHDYRDAGTVVGAPATPTFTPTPALAWVPVSAGLAPAGTLYTTFGMRFTAAAGPVDVTLRFVLPALRKLPFVGSPILTSGMQITRSATIANRAAAEISTARAIFFKLRLTAFTGGVGASRIFEWDDGTESNRVRVQVDSAGALSLRPVSGGVAGAQINGPTLALATDYGIGVSYDRATGLLTLWVNGIVYQLTGQTLPIGLTRRRFGSNAANTEPLWGWIDGVPRWGGAIAEYGRVPGTGEIAELMA